MKRYLLFPLLLVLAQAETVKDREGAVRGDKANMEGNERWIYNEVDKGFAEAKRTGKPYMVILRCVPCLSCMGLDVAVLTENEDLKPLMDQFVRARVINANSLDLQRFQFDYDLSFSVLFFNGDGTLYGRFGSWAHQKNPELAATRSFKTALEGALAIHKRYPTVKEALRGKQAKPMAFKRPIDMPHIKGRGYGERLNWAGKSVVKSCVHCHQIGDSLKQEVRNRPRMKMPLQLIYPHPNPETIGVSLDPERPLHLATVAPGSPAASAGLASGDRLLAVDGQPLISAADIAWALHHLPDEGASAALVFKRAGNQKTTRLDLPDHWRLASDISRRVGTWPMRAMAFGGMKLDPLPDEERKRLGIGDNRLGLLVKHVGQYGKHALAKKQGWRKGDILISVDGKEGRMTESRLIGMLMRDYQPGDRVPARVRRGGKDIDLKFPVQ